MTTVSSDSHESRGLRRRVLTTVLSNVRRLVSDFLGRPCDPPPVTYFPNVFFAFLGNVSAVSPVVNFLHRQSPNVNCILHLRWPTFHARWQVSVTKNTLTATRLIGGSEAGFTCCVVVECVAPWPRPGKCDVVAFISECVAVN